MNTRNKQTVREFVFSVLAQCLGDGGAAEKDGMVMHAAQRDYSQRWAEILVRAMEGRVAKDFQPHLHLSGADTGTGKTIGYAVPSLTMATMGQRIGIATSSHQLQRQMLGTMDEPGDLRKIAGWLQGLGLGTITIARRVGQQAFISANAIEDLLLKLSTDNESLTASEIAGIHKLHDWALASNKGSNSGLIEDVNELFEGELPAGLSPEVICLGADSPACDCLAYQNHIRHAETANVVLMSHQYLAACAMYNKGKLSDRGFDVLVIDEADRLSDVADQAFRFSMSMLRLNQLFTKLKTPKAEPVLVAIKQAWEVLSNIGGNNRSSAMALAAMSSYSRTTVDLAINRLYETMHDFKAKYKFKDKDIGDEVHKALTLLKRIKTTEDGELFASAVSFSPTKKFPSLSLMPMSSGPVLRTLWKQKTEQTLIEGVEFHSVAAVLFTSATLGVPGKVLIEANRFKGFAREMAIPMDSKNGVVVDSTLWAQFEPEKFGAVKYILADPSAPSPVLNLDENDRAIVNSEWVTYTRKMILAAHKAGGRTLVLTCSYADTTLLAASLKEHGLDVIEQERGQGMNSYVGQFKARENSVWLSPTAWEGLNLPGTIANLVIPRIPFRPMDEVVKALLIAQGKLTNTVIDKIISGRATNLAKRKFHQGLGRPIRSVKDRARIWIADPRFPISRASKLPVKYPDRIKFGTHRSYPAFHAVIANRFQKGLEAAQIFTMAGELLG